MSKQDLKTRFWAKVSPCPLTGCWWWTASPGPYGYGEIGVDGRTKKANRVAWELEYGPIPVGLHVLHRCDTPGCVNPEHLWLGTNVENAADRDAKGRLVRGERATFARLNASAVRLIRERSGRGETGASIARDMGVGQSTVSAILLGKAWGHVR